MREKGVRGLRRRRAGEVAAVCAVAIGLVLVGGVSEGQEEVKGKGDVKVRVVVEGGKAYKECVLYVKRERLVWGGKETERQVRGLEEGVYAVTAEALVGQGWFRDDARYLGVTQVSVEKGKTVEAVVRLQKIENVDGKRVDDFCSGCHPYPRGPIKAGQLKRDVHKSGWNLEKNKLLRKDSQAFVKQIKAYNERIAKMEKEGKKKEDAPYAIVTEQREVIEDGKKVVRTFSTCESCHTLHYKTPYNKYARASYNTTSELCEGCHF